MGGESPIVDRDTQLELVSDEARRELLIALLAVRTGTTDSVSVASLERDTQDRRIDFHHVHFPKLTANGIVEVVEPGDRVVPSENFHAIESLLETLDAARTEPVQPNG